MTAARSVHLFNESAQMPLPGEASTLSTVLLTVKVAAIADDERESKAIRKIKRRIENVETRIGLAKIVCFTRLLLMGVIGSSQQVDSTGLIDTDTPLAWNYLKAGQE
jgi:hypothetical protein